MDILKGYDVEQKGVNWIVRPQESSKDQLTREEIKGVLTQLSEELKKARITATYYDNNNDPRLVLWDME